MNQTPMKVLSLNLNLMPAGPLSVFTTSDTASRAAELAHSIIKINPDVFYAQELYHQQASAAFIRLMQQAGYQVIPGVGVHTLPKLVTYCFSSGQAFFVKPTIKVIKHQAVPFCDFGIRGTGPLETHVPKCALHLRIQTHRQ